ncbi:MAG: alpha/beta fold hydrolase [Candidatus Lokiarchaeota archaeon]|nr:alpha/beta fold hydrolase [Candidatus Lokiarchaeota archaeon]
MKLNVQVIKKVLLIASLAIISVGLIMSLIFNVILAPSTETHFTIRTDPDYPIYGETVDIDCILFQPKTQYDVYTSRPAVVLVHGFACSNVFFRGVAYELTKRGFVCLTISSRGHGGSGSTFGIAWENETISAVKYLRDYNASLRIDVNRIGLVGHSMGSMAVTLVSILDQERGLKWINATVGIGGPNLDGQNLFSTAILNAFGSPIVYPSIPMNLNQIIEQVNYTGRLNKSQNYLNIIGTLDEAFSVASAREVVFGSANTTFWDVYSITNYNQIVPSITYGGFNGSARRLVVLQNIDHLMECQRSETCIETINWFESAMKMASVSGYPGSLNIATVFEDYRGLAPWFVVVGVVILIIPASIYLGNWLKPSMKPPTNAQEFKKEDKKKLFLLYGGAFIGISFLTPLIILGANLATLIPTDFLMSNLITLPFLVQGLLMIPVIIALIYYEKKTINKKMELSDYGLTTDVKANAKSVTYVALLFGIISIIMNVGFSAVYFDIFIYRIFGYIEMVLFLFVGFLIFEIFAKGMIQNKFHKQHRFIKENIYAGVISGIIEGLGLSITMLFLMAFSGFNIIALAVFGINLPLILILPVLMIGLFIGLNIVMGLIYRKSNRNVIAAALFMALFLAWILYAALPNVIAYSPRFIFVG